MLSVFISGLSRQSGKTLVIAGLAGTMQSLNYSTGVYKPIQTGAKSLNGFLQSQDLALIKRIDSNINTYSSYVFLSENCPLVSAYEANNTKIDLMIPSMPNIADEGFINNIYDSINQVDISNIYID